MKIKQDIKLAARSGNAVTQDELDWSQKWVADNFSDSAIPPFSFVYDKQHSSDFLGSWQRSCSNEQRLGSKSVRCIKYYDHQTSLEVSCELTFYHDYSAVEWQLDFKNCSNHDTPILENIQALNMSLERENRPDLLYPANEFLLHWVKGCRNRVDDYATDIEVLDHASQIYCRGGRPASGDDTAGRDGALPFFNVQAIDRGLIIGVGWTGQWLAQFDRPAEKELVIKAGMGKTHLKLNPGEKIRSPRMLVFFWKGDRVSAQNKFRQFILDKVVPQVDGKPIQLPIAANGWYFFNFGSEVTEQNQIEFLQHFADKKIPLEDFWIDAGWYGQEDKNWIQTVGDWFPKKSAFPNGLKPVAEEARKHKMGFVVWFEPERVCPDTEIYNKYPEWVTKPPKGVQSDFALLNLGNPDARAWLTNRISSLIEENGITIYRQDMNFDPLPYWQSMDAPDRQGMAEIKHIEGLYEFWDELLRRHPNLTIDNCSAGGRRIDFETLKRSISLWRSDFTEPRGVQSHGFSLMSFVPTVSGLCTYFGWTDSYTFRSGLGNGITLGWDVKDTGFDAKQARKNMKEFELLRPLFYGDFYPMTEYSSSKGSWLAYQIHREDIKRGALVMFRRSESPFMTAKFMLRGLKADSIYCLKNLDSEATCMQDGQTLMSGVGYTLPEPQSSQIWVYEEKI